jgi:hypothetical protein
VDYQVLFNIALAGAAFFGGWVLTHISRALERLDEDVRKMPHHYVSRDDYRADVADIKRMLSRIHERLDDKADKADRH